MPPANLGVEVNENVSKSVLPYMGKKWAAVPRNLPYGCMLVVAEAMDNFVSYVLTNMNYNAHPVDPDTKEAEMEPIKGDARVATSEGTLGAGGT